MAAGKGSEEPKIDKRRECRFFHVRDDRGLDQQKLDRCRKELFGDTLLPE